ncbi:MAG: hypothetical protein IJ908_09690 [Fibrobacter sp.]|nr:hypothetical protein [Fibrobacter sp.]
MKNFKLVLVSLALFALVDCAGSERFISESWTSRPASIALIYTNPVVQNMDDVEDDLPEYVNSFPTWVTQEFKKNIEAQVNSKSGSPMRVDVVHYPVGSAGGPARFFMGESELRLDDKDFFAGDNEQLVLPEADVYLVLDALTFKNVNAVNSGAGLLGALLSYMMHSGDLFIEATFGFYDAKSHKRLGYGNLQSNEGYFFGVAKSSWENLMETAVEDLFDGTPISK